MAEETAEAVVRVEDVSVIREGNAILDRANLTVLGDERWAIIGANGSGKTTMLSVIGMRLLPTRGSVTVLGERAGRTDTRTMRARVAFVSGSVLRQLRPSMTAFEAVMSGRHAALETWWHDYTDEDRDLARQLLENASLGNLHHREFGLLSEGERQQVLLARALMGDPELLLLDEPAAGLDLAARERLISRLADLAEDPASPPMILVTHHTEEIPPGVSHAALMRAGRVVTTGPVQEVLTDGCVSRCFGANVHIEMLDGRWFAVAGH